MADKSSYVFDNLEPKEQLHAKPVELMGKGIPSEQWNYFDYAVPEESGFDGFDTVWNLMTQIIGICLVAFSELENELENNIYEIINDRTDHIGMIVTRTMTFEQKLQTYIDLLRSMNIESIKQYESDVGQLKKHLKRAGEVRNVIAHAKWPSLNEEGYVFSSIDAVSSSVPELSLKYYQLDKEQLENYRAYIQAVTNMLSYVQSEHFEH